MLFPVCPVHKNKCYLQHKPIQLHQPVTQQAKGTHFDVAKRDTQKYKPPVVG